jgi:hypothetical protein
MVPETLLADWSATLATPDGVGGDADETEVGAGVMLAGAAAEDIGGRSGVGALAAGDTSGVAAFSIGLAGAGPMLGSTLPPMGVWAVGAASPAAGAEGGGVSSAGDHTPASTFVQASGATGALGMLAALAALSVVVTAVDGGTSVVLLVVTLLVNGSCAAAAGVVDAEDPAPGRIARPASVGLPVSATSASSRPVPAPQNAACMRPSGSFG